MLKAHKNQVLVHDDNWLPLLNHSEETKDQDGGCKLKLQGQRDLDRIAGQVAAANKNH